MMILSSTLFLTVLLVIGLVFFIRGSVKDRTEQVQLITYQVEDSVYSELRNYLSKRAYQLKSVDEINNVATFEGIVRPSWFLAIFLSILAACGILCLGLVVSMLVENSNQILFFAPVMLSGLVGRFYWRGASRTEQVKLTIAQLSDQADHPKCLVTIKAHRDEIATLRQSLGYQVEEVGS